MSIRVLLGLSLLLLTLSAVFGFLNTGKVRALRTEAANANAARAIAENARIAQRRQTKGTGPSANSNNAQTEDEQARLATAEAEAAKAQSEKAEALAKLQSTENRLAQLQKNIQVGGTNTAESGGPSVAELRTQLDEARHSPKMMTPSARKFSSAKKPRAITQPPPRRGRRRRNESRTGTLHRPVCMERFWQ